MAVLEPLLQQHQGLLEQLCVQKHLLIAWEEVRCLRQLNDPSDLARRLFDKIVHLVLVHLHHAKPVFEALSTALMEGAFQAEMIVSIIYIRGVHPLQDHTSTSSGRGGDAKLRSGERDFRYGESISIDVIKEMLFSRSSKHAAEAVKTFRSAL